MKRIPWLLVVGMSLASPAARGDVVSYTTHLDSSRTELATTLQVHQFDSALGTLLGVTVEFSGRIDSTATFTNNAAIAETFTFGISSDFTLAPTATTALHAMPTFSQSYALNSLQTMPGIAISASGQGTLELVDAADFAPYVGAGTVGLGLATLTGTTFQGGGGNIRAQVQTFGSGDLRVTYRFQSVPEPTSLALLALGAIPPLLRTVRRGRIAA